jgi:hypothetical protein
MVSVQDFEASAEVASAPIQIGMDFRLSAETAFFGERAPA